MKFLGNVFSIKSKSSFESIQGYEDVKEIVQRALDSKENYNILFVGPPASSKTMFLMGIQDIRKDAIYFDSTNTTNRILDILEEKRPKILLLDEIDKMSKQFAEKLLNFLEDGHVKVDQQKKSYDFTIKGVKVFASCNEINRMPKPLRSRFRKLFLPRYTEQQFIDVSVKVLKNLSDPLARYIGSNVFRNGGDIRDVISIGKLVTKGDGPAEVDSIVKTLAKYGQEEQN